MLRTADVCPCITAQVETLFKTSNLSMISMGLSHVTTVQSSQLECGWHCCTWVRCSSSIHPSGGQEEGRNSLTGQPPARPCLHPTSWGGGGGGHKAHRAHREGGRGEDDSEAPSTLIWHTVSLLSLLLSLTQVTL
jgi:hypothetical protein